MPSESPAPVAPAPRPQVTGPLVAYVAASGATGLPGEVEELATDHILDTLASIVACRDLPAGRAARRYAVAHSAGTAGGVRILGARDTVSLVDAAFASAVTAHGAEVNDFCPSAFVQPGPPVASTALCLAAARGRSGRDVVRAVVAGYEVACRLPKALGLANLRRAGLANHGIGGLFGAAVAAASLLGLSEDEVRHLLSYCAQEASGSWQWMLDVEHLEKAFVFGGMGARNGLHAALLVEAGFTGVGDALDLRGGWLSSPVFTGPDSDADLGYLVEGLGERFELPLVGYKRYPVGGPVQPAVQALLHLVREHGAASITRVHVEMPGAARTFAAARMPALNLPYLCAVVLLDGELGFEAAQSLERFRHAADVHALMARVTVAHDPAQEAEPRAESARVTVTLATGERHSAYVGHVTGYPSHPMARAEVVDKARGLLATHLAPDAVDTVIELTSTLAHQPTVLPLLDALAGETT